MKKKLTLFLILLSLSFIDCAAQEKFTIKGVTLPRNIEFQKKKLSLNGFGTRSRFWTEVYVQALYLSILSEDAEDILNSDTEMAIRLQITSSLVTPQKLSKSLYKGITKSIGSENLPKFKMQLDLLEKLLTKEDTKENDGFNLIYSPVDEQIYFFKNDTLEGKIPGLDFKKALFGIWLSKTPVDPELKNALLGKVK